jgi:SAM-dependent methyltransferase
MENSNKDSTDWILDIVCCPECGSDLQTGSNPSRISCQSHNCDFCTSREGPFLDLLPEKLDRFQKAENQIRSKSIESLEITFDRLEKSDLKTLNLVDIITDFRFTSQFRFFRDYFFPRHRLSGRGLEIGGAAGQQSGFIRLFYPDTEVVTSDIAPINMAVALELAELLRFRTDYFVLANAERLPFKPDSFDFLFSSGMLHHLGNPVQGILAAKSALKPGGKWYIVNELSIGSLPRLFWNSRYGQKGRWGIQAGVHEKSYRLTEWKQMFEENGFSICEIHFHRVAQHKLLSWPRAAYYAFISRLPELFIRLGLPCEVNFVLEKPAMEKIPV